MEKIGIEAVAIGPLEITCSLGPQGSAKTTVTGDARNVATVQIYNGSSIIYSGTMDQASPDLKVPRDLIIGNMKWSKVEFQLTVPTSEQPGNVFMSAEVSDPQHPVRTYQAQIAMWPLTGSVS